MAEYFDICDEHGNPTGEIIERGEAHRKGVLHRTVHIWVTRVQDGRRQVLLQKRSADKDSFPGMYDTSSAGHIQAGDAPLESALRELEEELGIHAEPGQLHFAGNCRICFEGVFHDAVFKEDEVAFVYVYEEPVRDGDLRIQKEELESVEWFDLEAVEKEVREGGARMCVPPEGIAVLEAYLKKQDAARKAQEAQKTKTARKAEAEPSGSTALQKPQDPWESGLQMTLFEAAKQAGTVALHLGNAAKQAGEAVLRAIEDSAPYRKYELRVQRGDVSLAVTKFTPAGLSNGIPVILSHAFMGSRKDTYPYARKLAEWGYTAYALDFAGGGPGSESDGEMTEMSVLTEREDLFALMDYVRKDPAVLAERLVLLGFSQGGLVSALAAASRREQVDRLILVYPALCIPDDARRGRMLHGSFDPANVPAVMTFEKTLRLGRKYVTDVLQMDAFAEISGFDGEVLIIHGAADRLVDPAYAKKAQQTYADAQLFLVQGAGHGFSPQQDLIAIDVIREFLLDRTEVLTVDLRLGVPEMEKSGSEKTLTLPIEGTARSAWFEGVIGPDSKDVRKIIDDSPAGFRATYDLRGVDHTKHSCTIHIENRTADSTSLVTEIETDSEALSFLNDASCGAVLELRGTGVIVHIFAAVPDSHRGRFSV